MTAKIQFMGREYASVEQMPSDIRQAYESMKRGAASGKTDDEKLDDLLSELGGEKNSASDGAPDEGPDALLHELTEDADKLTPAWGGHREQGSVPIPRAFESVASLGPATAVYGRNSAVLLPGFGAPKALVLYRDGFAYQTGAKDIHMWRWEEVVAILTNVRMSDAGHAVMVTDHEYTLAKGSGGKLVLDDVLKDVEEIIEPIKRNVFALLLPPLTHQYNSGQAVTFGPVTIHRQNGLQTGGKLYAWEDIMDIKVESGRFTITMRDSKRHEARVSAIPNIELLCQMIGLKLLSPQLTY